MDITERDAALIERITAAVDREAVVQGGDRPNYAADVACFTDCEDGPVCEVSWEDPTVTRPTSVYACEAHAVEAVTWAWREGARGYPTVEVWDCAPAEH